MMWRKRSEVFRMGSVGLMELLVICFVLLIAAVPFWKIAAKTGYPGFMGLGALIPGFNVVLLLFLAFRDWPIERELRALRHRGRP